MCLEWQQSQEKCHVCKTPEGYEGIKLPKSILKLQPEYNQVQSNQRQCSRLIYSINQLSSVKPFHFKALSGLSVGIEKTLLVVTEILH